MEQVENKIKQMTLEEKASLCSGKNFWELQEIDRLQIPSLLMTDGPHGLRKQKTRADHLGIAESIPATCFPTASLLASTWNAPLLHKMGVALAEECIDEGVSVLLGPGVNIKRSPLGGRNFEYFSEDPYLSASLATELVKGIQSLGVGTSLKHFAANNQEYRRMLIDAVIDTRTLRELYLASFEKVVKEAKPKTVMCAYNKLNGNYCSENEWLLTHVLRDEWGYDGVVITDWGATNDRVKGLIAGQDIEMPGVTHENNHKIIEAVKSGLLDEKILDRCVARNIKLVMESAQSSGQTSQSQTLHAWDEESHHQLAREIASEGIVLLKNENILPLEKNTKVALIGQMAKIPRYQGSGSSFINPTKLDTIHDAFIELLKVNEDDKDKDLMAYAAGYLENGDLIDESLIEAACQKAMNAEVVCVFVGLTEDYESEGFDRTTLDLPKAHNALIERVLTFNKNVVVVLSNGAPVAMPWHDKVPAIVEGYLGGQAGAGALVDVLYGIVNPSGHLAETFPVDLEASKYFPGNKKTVEYREGLYVGYRYYDTFDKAVLFPFGHGLSYTEFEITKYGIEPLPQLGPFKISGDEGDLYRINCSIKNCGDRKGKAVVQLYVADLESSFYRPEKELKGYQKIDLEPDQEKELVFYLNKRSFAFYDVDSEDWAIENGTFEVSLGFSSRNLPIKFEIDFSASDWTFDASKDHLANDYYKNREAKDLEIPDSIFSSLIGRSLHSYEKTKRDAFDMNTPIAEMRDTLIGKILHGFIALSIRQMVKEQQNAGMKKMIESVVDEITLRNMSMMSDGKVTLKMAESFLLMAKGHYLHGFKHVLSRKSIKSKA